MLGLPQFHSAQLNLQGYCHKNCSNVCPRQFGMWRQGCNCDKMLIHFHRRMYPARNLCIPLLEAPPNTYPQGIECIRDCLEAVDTNQVRKICIPFAHERGAITVTFPEGNLGIQVDLKIGQICIGVPLRLVARQSSAPDLMCPHVERSFAKSSLQ